MQHSNLTTHSAIRNLLIIFFISIGIKLYASQLLVWEADYVPVLERGQAWLNGGAFPAVGTLSSVAAYNMPFLAWMQIPVMLFTRDVATILIITQLIFNFLATWFVFRLGSEMFRPLVGLVAATLFTFSETGISSAYTAWAQLLLPGFYVMVMYGLYRWKADEQARYIALVIILATAAFMTHFSAVLLYGMIFVFWLILRLKFSLRWFIFGISVSALMLTPYMLVQVDRDFVDLKAFFTRQTTIDQSILDEYAYLKAENQPRANPVQPSQTLPPSQPETPTEPPRQPSRLERGIAWVISIPLQVIQGIRLVFNTDLVSLRQYFPTFHMISAILRALLELSFWGGIIYALYHYLKTLRINWHNIPDGDNRWRYRLNLMGDSLISLSAGRNLLLFLFIIGIVSGLILVRAAPDQQATYYIGIVSIQFVMCAYGIGRFMSVRQYGIRILILVALFVGLGSFDRVVRVINHNPNTHSLFNIALYQSIAGASEWIADDWGTTGDITISYDVMPEMAHQWWIVPWHTVDDSYRIGMTYDYLLTYVHGLQNQNTNPIGLADNPDYIITYQPGLSRYNLDEFMVHQIGAIYILTPIRL